MNKDINISIIGIQTLGDEHAKITSSSTGTYYKKNDKHYILYNEYDGDNQITNTLVINPFAAKFDLIKKGATNSHQCFCAGEKYASSYRTSYGAFLMLIETTKLDMHIDESSINIDVEYELYLNDEYISHNQILIKAE